jgi:MFS family permease
MTKPYIRNSIYYAAGEGIWGFQFSGLVSVTVLSVLIRKHGGSAIDAGAISGVENLAILAQLAGLYLFHSRRHRKRRLLWWYVIIAIPMLAVMGVVNHSSLELSPLMRRIGLLVTFGVYMGLTHAGVSAWNDWAAHIFPKRVRGKTIGIGMGMFSLLGTAGMLVTSKAVKQWGGGPTGTDIYTWLYFIGAGVGVVAMGLYALVTDHDAPTAVDPPRPKAGELFRRFGHSLADRNFSRYLFGRILATAGLCGAALVAVYYQSAEGGGLKEDEVIAIAAVLPAAQAAGCFLLGALGDRRGHRLTTLIQTAVQVGTVTVLLLTSGETGCLIAHIGLGLALGGSWVSGFNMMVESCPHDNRMAHITVSSIVLGLPMAVVPVMRGWVAEQWNFSTLFTICLGLNIVAFVWLAMMVKEPRTLDVYQSD